MRRRSILAAAATLAAGSGCLRVLGENPTEVRAMRASADAVQSADEHCQLSTAFLDDHPVLERVVTSAATAPTGEWVVAEADAETGDALAATLEERCGQAGAVYHYEDEAYRVAVRANGTATREGASPAQFGSD